MRNIGIIWEQAEAVVQSIRPKQPEAKNMEANIFISLFFLTTSNNKESKGTEANITDNIGMVKMHSGKMSRNLVLMLRSDTDP